MPRSTFLGGGGGSFLAESELSSDTRTTTFTKRASFALVPFQLRPSLPPSMTVPPPQGALNSTTKQATIARCHTATTNPFVDLFLASIMTPGPSTGLNAPSETSSSKTWTRLCTIGTPTSTTWIANPYHIAVTVGTWLAP